MSLFLDQYFFGFGGRYKYKGAANEALINKNMAYLDTFYQNLTIWASRFKYKFPESMDDRTYCLDIANQNMSGIMAYEGEVINLRPISINDRTRYGYPLSCEMIDFTGKSYGRRIPNSKGNQKIANCAIVYGNKINIPPIIRILFYSRRMAELQTSISAAISNLKGTVAIRCEEEQKEKVVKNWTAAGNGVPMILTYSGSSDYGNIPELLCNPATGDVLKTLLEAYDKTVSEFCSEFGINSNAVVNKLSGVSDEELKQNEERARIAIKSDYECQKEYLEMASELPEIREILDNEGIEKLDIEYNFDISLKPKEEKGESENE